MLIRTVLQGQWTVQAIADDAGRCALLEFMRQLTETGNKGAADALALLQSVAESPDGPKALPAEQSKPIKGVRDLFEFKRDRVRILWFYDGRRVIVCTGGFIKTDKKAQDKQAKKAGRLMKAYLSNKDRIPKDR